MSGSVRIMKQKRILGVIFQDCRFEAAIMAILQVALGLLPILYIEIYAAFINSMITVLSETGTITHTYLNIGKMIVVL